MMMWVLAIDSTGMQSTESGVAHQGVLAGAKAYGRDAGLVLAVFAVILGEILPKILPSFAGLGLGFC